ncbi:hypothetical protein BJ165DRAFT_1532155 [Panaeolus papilionaceus]|nr:hypothetical protein BJ165DRAFT_1532155 [Panaeolus papilionaceus]
MQLQSALLFFSFAIIAATAADAEPAVFTVEEVFATIVDTAPFMAEATTTHVWTQSPSIEPTETVVAPTPSLDPAYDTAA